LRRPRADPAGARRQCPGRWGQWVAGVLERDHAHPQADFPDPDQPVDHLGLPGLHPDLGDAEQPAGQWLLHNGGLLLLRILPHHGGAALMGTIGRRRGLTRRQRTTLLANLTGLLVFTLLMFPAYWMVATAFKPGRDILRLTPQWFPVNATLANFIDAVGRPFFLEDARNSVVITLSALTISIVVAFLAAVAVARFGFRGRAAFVVIIIAVQMIPLTALIIPLYLLLDKVGQTDTLTGVILTYLILVLPFMVWTLRGFIINVPVELE